MPRRWGLWGLCEGSPQRGRSTSGKGKTRIRARGKVWGMSLEWGEKCEERPWEWLCWIPWQPAQSKSTLQPAEEPVLEQGAFPEGTRQRRGTRACGEPTLEQQRGAVMDRTQPTFPLPSALLRGQEEVEALGTEELKLSLQKDRVWEKVFRFYLRFSPSKCIWTGNKLIFPELSLFCLWRQLVSDVPVFISTHEVFHPIFSHPVRGRVPELAGWASSQPRSSGKGRAERELGMGIGPGCSMLGWEQREALTQH